MTAARVATIDIGTNSVLLLIAEERGGVIVPVAELATITRLGQGVDATRALAPEAVERTLACIAEYAEEIRRAGAARIDVVGTSAMRDARGGDDFRARASALLGVTPRVISGDEEAALTFEGALAGLSLPAGEATVFDIGGGSTEIIHGDASGRPRDAVSLDIGSVRLTERHVRSNPPRADQLEAVRDDARRALATAPRASTTRGARALVGVAGTVTTIAAWLRDVAPYDAARIHGAHLRADEVARARAELAAMPLAERRALPTVPAARADVIVAGCLIVEELLAWAGAGELVVSDRGVRWGLAKRLLAAGASAS